MSANFINSEICEIDGKGMIYFRQPGLLLEQIQITLEKIGAKEFFRSPTEEIKKVRESMAELFFQLAIQKKTSKDWFLMQPQQDPPDFVLMNVDMESIDISMEQFELVEIPPICETFEDMEKIVEKKLKKGYPPGYNLLIFVNHIKSKEWITRLHSKLKSFLPFKAVWTIHLLFEHGEIWGSVVNRLRPEPVWHIPAKLSDTRLSYSKKISSWMEEIKVDGKKMIGFKPAIIKKLISKLKKKTDKK